MVMRKFGKWSTGSNTYSVTLAWAEENKIQAYLWYSKADGKGEGWTDYAFEVVGENVVTFSAKRKLA